MSFNCLGLKKCDFTGEKINCILLGKLYLALPALYDSGFKKILVFVFVFLRGKIFHFLKKLVFFRFKRL